MATNYSLLNPKSASNRRQRETMLHRSFSGTVLSLLTRRNKSRKHRDPCRRHSEWPLISGHRGLGSYESQIRSQDWMNNQALTTRFQSSTSLRLYPAQSSTKMPAASQFAQTWASRCFRPFIQQSLSSCMKTTHWAPSVFLQCSSGPTYLL